MTTTDIANALHSDEYGGWSYAGAYALAEWLEAMEEGSSEEMEFDRVAIRCDFSEYDSLFDWAESYYGGMQFIPDEWLTQVNGTNNTRIDVDLVREYIQDHGVLVEFDGGIIVSSF